MRVVLISVEPRVAAQLPQLRADIRRLRMTFFVSKTSKIPLVDCAVEVLLLGRKLDVDNCLLLVWQIDELRFDPPKQMRSRIESRWASSTSPT